MLQHVVCPSPVMPISFGQRCDRRCLGIAVALWLTLPWLGCQTLDLSSVSADAEAEVTSAETAATKPGGGAGSSADEAAGADAQKEPAVDPFLVDSFRRWLDQDEWQVDVTWSVLGDEIDCPTRPWRFLFVVESTAVDQGKSKQGEILPGSERWDWIWSGNSTHASTRDRQAALGVLSSLQGDADRIARNAAILLARLQPESGSTPRDLLRRIAAGNRASNDAGQRSPLHELPLMARCAAAEAYCRSLASDAGEPETNLAPAGSLLNLPGLADELQGTLWRSLAYHIVPDRIPQLSDVISQQRDSRSVRSQRQAALEACVIAAARQRSAENSEATSEYREIDWPTGLLALRFEDAPVMRQLVGRWAAWVRHPDALTLLVSQNRDVDPAVREAAVTSLGMLGTRQAVDNLHVLARGSNERIQGLAISALGRIGDAEILRYAGSASPQVRAAVARSLRSTATAEGRACLRRLLVDASPEVQSAAVAAASRQPAEHAVPLLLTAVESGEFAARKAAQQALFGLLSNPPLFPLEGTLIERRDAVRVWAATRGYSLEPWIGTMALNQAADSAADNPEIANLLQALMSTDGTGTVQSDILDRLQRTVAASDIAQIEAAFAQGPRSTVRRLQQEVLPKVSANYAALTDLESPVIQRRRDAARRLQQQSTVNPLSPAFVNCLGEILAHEQDQLVWQACLASVQADGHDAAGRLALLALNHSWPDLRRMGAEYFQRHPAHEAVAALMPLLRDNQSSVQLAAVRALGASGNPLAILGYPAGGPEVSVGLRELMNSRHEEVRWAALAALASLHDEPAVLELIRLTEDAQPETRGRAVQAMGLSGHRRFVDPIIRMSWTESNDVVKRAILDALSALVPMEQHPACETGLVAAASIDDKIQCWVAWWDARRTRSAVASPRNDGAEGIR